MRRHTGLSLWSILLVIAVIGILVPLLLPATHSAREYRRATKSKSQSASLEDVYVQAQDRTISASSNASASSFESAGYQRLGSLDKAITLAQNVEAAEVARKIIYEADLTVVVKDVGAAEKKLLALLKELGGYIAEATVNRAEGQQISGQWRVRIPVTHFEGFLEDVSRLGVPENRRQTAQDVTEEYVDLEAQIASKKQLEQRVLGLLEKSTDKIADVIAVEHELGRVRGEIERMEGRLRFLSNRTDFTTVSISLREEQEYQPETAPTFTARIGEAWHASLQSLRAFGGLFLLATVAAFPWIVIASVILLPSFWYGSKRLQRKKAQS